MILALDLGTKTGWCAGADRPEANGVWDLKPGRFSSAGMRFVRFRSELESILRTMQPTIIVYEEVRRHAGTDAAHVYGGLMASLQVIGEDYCIPYEAVPVGTIKRSWTGKGNADKVAMMAEAVRRGFKVKDDNEADAIALWHYWREQK